MTKIPLPVTLPAAAVDAFGRQRVSEPHTLWESKLLYDASSLFWDEAETSGSGTGTSHSTALARVRMSVGAATAGRRVRQTYRRFNYQPGKSQQALITFAMGPAVSGVTKRVGLYDDNNGFYVEQSGSSFGFGIRTAVSGTPVDKFIGIDDWNIKSARAGDLGQQQRITINGENTQIFFLDYEWLGVGTARYGLVVDGQIHYFHAEHHANYTTGVYISTPNLPMRYEIIADGTNVTSAYLDCICNTVISEGGIEELGILRHNINPSSMNTATSAVWYPAIGMRVSTNRRDQTVYLEDIHLLGEDTGTYQYALIWNPDISNSSQVVSTAQPNSAVEILYGTTETILSSGTIIEGGWFQAGRLDPETQTGGVQNSLVLGHDISSTPDELWLAVQSGTTGLGFFGGLGWREL